MSELKRYEIDTDYPNDIVGGSYYDVDEVDKVIAKKDAEIFNLKEELSYIKADSTFDREKHKTEVKELLCLIRDKENNFNRAFDSEEKEIAELKEQLKNSRNARKYWRNEYLIEYKECLSQKYKRCMAMAKWCARYLRWVEEEFGASPYYNYYERWRKRWLELAEKFKEAK